MKIKRRIIILSVLTFLILFPSFIHSEFWMKLLNKHNLFSVKNEIKVKLAGYWNLTGAPIFIDGSATGIGAHNWTWAESQAWCNGSGTWSDPNIIENVTIDGQNSGSCIEIRNSNVFFIIRNCTLYNSGSGSDDAGIFLYRTDNSQLLNNTCNSNKNYGIFLDDCRNHTIYKNILNNNDLTGIRLLNSNDNNISRNVANFNTIWRGIELYQSDDNYILQNEIIGNGGRGIYFYDCHYNTISGNIVLNNEFGINIMNSNYNDILKNTVYDNTDEGITLSGSHNNYIFKNLINNSIIGLNLHPGQYCTIVSNNISFCDNGIHVYDDYYNTFSENSISNNTLGVYIERGMGNTLVYRNYFKGNTIHAIDNSTNNNWNNTLMGNYWDNYTGTDTDNDGRGDTPYNVSGTAGSIDHLPIYGDPFFVPNQIHIDDTGVSGYRWTWVATRAWGSGSGINLDPYVIKDITLDAGNAGDCILIGNSSVYFTIENCTILNYSNFPKAGIRLVSTDNGQLIDNNCSSVWAGYGISLQNSDNNIISGNRVNNNPTGILLSNSHLNDIMDNTLFDNDGFGISLQNSIDNDIINNTINIGNYGIYSFNGNGNDMIGNKINQMNQYGIFLEYGNLDTLSNNEITYCDHGIHIWDTTFEDINDNIIENNNYGIHVEDGEDINFLRNLIDDNNYGIHLEGGSYNTIISNNTISNSYYWGAEIFSTGATFYHNTFLTNPVHAIDNGSSNAWDNGVIGNYWDDYSDDDLNDDGIGDTPYSIGGSTGSLDHFPIWRDSDDIAPQITINTPNPYDLMGKKSPTFNITISDQTLNSTWYRLWDGTILTTNTSFEYLFDTEIDQNIWSEVGNGTVTLIFFANDSIGRLTHKNITVRKDIEAPQITINSPANSDIFANSAPAFSLNILEGNIDTSWYTINNGITNITFIGSSGSINQTEWNKKGSGTIIIRFYANDTAGNLGSNELTINKDIEVPQITINSPASLESFLNLAPTFSLNILEANLDTMWYTIDGGITNITFIGFSGGINQTEWNKKGIGEVVITFYANDTVGHIGNQSVTIEKYYEYWPLDPLIIDDSGSGDYTWGEAVIQGWCSGSGTENDPYIIELIEIDGQSSGSCIIISNSNVSFIISNCSFYNSGNNQNDAGIELINLSNGELIYLNCSFNNRNGILLDSCQYVNITSSTVDYNGLNGIKLVACNYINILNNMDTMNWNNENGIYLFNSHNNVITYNVITNNDVGIYLDQSNSNYIDWNNLLGNREAYIDNGSFNIFGANNNLPIEPSEFPFEILMIILIIGIVAVGVTGAVLLVKKRRLISGLKKKEISEKKREKVKRKLEEKFEKVPKVVPVIAKGKKYNVFISYSSLDLDHFQINKIVDGLEKYPEIEKVYYYVKDSGQNIVEFMEKTLSVSTTFVLFCTGHSKKSKSVEGEWQAAYQLSKKGVVKIIPVYEDEEYIPILLTPLLNVKFTEDDLDGFIQRLFEEILR